MSMPSRPCLSRALQQQRGAATLLVVLMLFFVVSLVAAYTSRNLIFEQRTSVNQYRSTMVFETAEAAQEWVLGMINGGRIGADCTETSAVATDTSFRQRYLVVDPNTGLITPKKQGSGAALWPTCVATGAGGWSCSCPIDSAPVMAAPVGNDLRPAFRVQFDQLVGLLNKPGTVRVSVHACMRVDDEACLANFDNSAQASDGRAQHAMVLALKSALTTPPAAALTVVGSVPGPAVVQAENTDLEAGGITVQAGGAIAPAAVAPRTVPGTPPAKSLAGDDGALSALAANPAYPDRVFASTFGVFPATHRDQPAALVLDCPNTGCRQALSDLVARNPDRVIWIPGDLTLETAGDVGSAPNPADPTVAGAASIVVQGRLRFTAVGVRIHGFVYTRDGNWEGTGEIRGAAMTEGNLSGTAAPTVVYDKALLQAARRQSGSFVRLPGDWKDWKPAF
jgi:Tfp pilus assembly protein PilX